MKKKLLLVNPRAKTLVGSMDFASVESITNRSGRFLNLGLATVAALTPPEFEIRIIDEHVEDIDFDEHYDIVGITGYPSQVNRAQIIASKLRERGAIVACGGPTVTVLPELWRPFSDVLFFGEAERTWPKFIEDYRGGHFADEYRETEWNDLSIAPLPDYSGYNKETLKEYLGGIVNTSRGCPYNCEYCAAIVLHGRKVRTKPVDQIIQEIDQLHSMGMSFILLTTENFAINRTHAKQVLQAIGDWNRKQRHPVTFQTSVSIEAADDDEFLVLAAEAGLLRVLIGIETFNQDSLKETGKLHNLQADLQGRIKRFHEHGILVQSGCLLGFDHDDLSNFRTQYDFFSAAGIPLIGVYPLQAMAGTQLKDRMIREGRFIVPDFTTRLDDHTPTSIATLIPKQMTVEQVRQGAYWLFSQFYDWEAFTKRFKIFFDNYRSSPKRGKLRIPRSLRMTGLIGIGFRFLRYLIFRAASDERRAILTLVKDGWRSSHPQGVVLGLGTFLVAKDLAWHMHKENPRYTETEYPT